MPEVGLEPTRAEARGILSPLRLPSFTTPARLLSYYQKRAPCQVFFCGFF